MNTFAVQFQGVSKHYPHFSLDDVHFDLPEGHIMGFIGPNGAGKSTTMRILMGLVHQDEGDVYVLGKTMPAEQQAAKWDIGFVSEDMRLYKSATLGWHMNFIRSIYPTWDDAYAERLVRKFNLIPEQKIKGLSHGQRVKATLLLVLARHPRLLVLDEPTTGLDPVARQEVLTELMEVIADEERTILFSSHNTLDVEQLSDQITFIDRGRIIDTRNKEHFLDSWRRIRLEVPEETELPQLDDSVDVQRSRRLAIVTTNAFNHDLPHAYQEAGATVLGIENMTLEEIFVANVQRSRVGEAV